MLFRGVLSSFKRECSAIVSDKLYLAVVLLLPLLMTLFFGVMFYRGTIRDLPIVVVDRDNSSMSRKLCSMIDATPGVDIAFMKQSITEAESLMLSGKVVAIAYIDDGFERDIYGGVKTSVQCYLLGTNISASGIVEQNIEQVVETFSAGIALEKLQNLGVSPAQAMVYMMPIKVKYNIISNPYLNYGYYLAPIFMIMGVIIFTILSSIYAIGRELRYGTAMEWMVSSGNSLLLGLVGKLLPVTIAMGLISQLIYFMLFVVMGMECAGSYLYLSVATLVFILAYQAVAIALISITANLRLALSLGGGYGVMAFTFSGITFPTMAMFGIARFLSKLFPLTYFSEVFIDQATRGTPIHYDIEPLLYMLLFLLLIPLSWRRLAKVVTCEKCWGGE